MKSKIVEDILNSITEEEMSDWRKKKLDTHKSLTIDEMLGFFIGEEICRTNLPRLSTDGFSRSIKVSNEDEQEYNRLRDIWSSKYNHTNPEASHDEWVEYRKFARVIEKKYLPNPFYYRSSMLNVDNINDIDKFKTNLIHSLWDDDFCHYSLNKNNIKIYNDNEEGVGVIELIYVETEVI
jgi:hypothetical protein